MTEIGKKIREARKKKGLSQEQLSESAKVNLRTIQRIENNESAPRGKTISLICNALDLNSDDIIEFENQLNKNYLIFSILLTSLVFVGSFLGWFTFEAETGSLVEKFGKMRITTTGWNGKVSILKVLPINHWLISLCSLSIGCIIIIHALGLINKHFKYIIGQLILISVYTIFIIISGLMTKNFGFQLGLFLVTTATLGLVVLYFRTKE